jgi:hypothetical protein
MNLSRPRGLVAMLLIAGGWLGLPVDAQPIGACCCTDGTCVVVEETDCAVIRRGDVNCDGVVDFADINVFVLRLSDLAQYQAQYPDCPDANGDINGDGTVDFMDINPFAALLTEGNGATCTWHGAGTSCEACWQPSGACCLTTGECLPALPASDCEAQGGQWQGAETVCDPNPCIPATGACCHADGSCDVWTEAECNAQEGHWQGAATTCDPNPCWPECADWNAQPGQPSPLPRAGHALAFDAARGVSVLFGGDYAGETWEWDGSTWTQRFSDPTPAARSQDALAYDAARGVVLLFGGVGGEQLFGDTWTWDGSQWAQLFPASSPAPRAGHALAYDAARGLVVLFGGVSAGHGVWGDTWEWDGYDWTQRQVAGPSPRFGHALAYDDDRNVVVLFGGFDEQAQQYDGQTWEWNGAVWTLRSSTGPAPRAGHTLVYHAARHSAVLFGGQESGGVYSGDTWLWDGSGWSAQAPQTGPAPRFLHAMTYDSLRAETVLFGGAAVGYYGDTWTLALLPAPQFTQPPADVAACDGQSVQFAVAAQGIGPLAYQWYRDGVLLVDLPPVSGATTPTLTIAPATAGDAGQYTAVVIDQCAAVSSAPAVLVVRPLTQITTQPEGLSRCAGQSAVFQVAANGADLTYQWRKDGQALADDARISGTTTATLSVEPVGLSDAGSYDVLVTGTCGSETSAAAVLVATPVTQITEQPQSLTRTEGAAAVFTVLAVGSDLTYQWLKDGQPLADNQHVSGAASATLRLDPLALADAGGYAAQVSGACGAQLSAAALLVVLPDRDHDEIPDESDNCPAVPNPAQLDADGDGLGDACDGCPTDPQKASPGICGCGVADTDSDGDGTPDCFDGCPDDPLKISSGACGCGTPDTDSDGDGTPDCADNCPDDPDKTAPGACGCGVADTDSDGDHTPDCFDGCSDDPLKVSPGACGCGRPDTDSDGDGTPDCSDDCPADPLKTEPGLCGCGILDADTDGDGIVDCLDNCPTSQNPEQVDSDADGTGDACDDDQGELPRPSLADSSFIRGLIDIITGNGDSADADHSAAVLGQVVNTLEQAAADGADPNSAGSAPDQAARPALSVGTCPASSALMLGLTLVGLYVAGARRGKSSG